MNEREETRPPSEPIDDSPAALARLLCVLLGARGDMIRQCRNALDKRLLASTPAWQVCPYQVDFALHSALGSASNITEHNAIDVKPGHRH